MTNHATIVSEIRLTPELSCLLDGGDDNGESAAEYQEFGTESTGMLCFARCDREAARLPNGDYLVANNYGEIVRTTPQYELAAGECWMRRIR